MKANWLTLLTIVLYLIYIWLCYFSVHARYFAGDGTVHHMEFYIKFLRLNNCLIIVVMVLKGFTFLRLHDQISVFIDIFYQIFYDIVYFGLILVLFAFAFSNCFWLISKN